MSFYQKSRKIHLSIYSYYDSLAIHTKNTACIFQRYTHPEEHINVEHIRNKRDVATDSMTQFIANLVKSEVRQT